MKKIIFTLLALVGTMSMNAQKVQVMKIMKNGEVIAKYKAAEADEVVFAEELETTGKAYATGPDCEVNWVQLWAGGPKFAEYNVGASRAADKGSTMTFTNATKAGADYVWGANWCTPSKEDMDELLKAATDGGSEKVKCEYTQENSVWGFKFTGKAEGYTGTSVFFPVQDVYSDYGYAYYWSATANGSNAWSMYLDNDCGDWYSRWYSCIQDNYFLVRPVLFEEAPAAPTTGTEKRKGDIEVNWIQLWKDGPKFAEYNVGASSAADKGSTMTFTEATSADYVWGANWCTPSKEDMDELLKAATDGGSEKVKCEYTQENSVWGFKFTGKAEGYTGNSVFFPAQSGDSDYGYAYYWSATANGSNAWSMNLDNDCGDWYSRWYSGIQGNWFLVRPVLKN